MIITYMRDGNWRIKITDEEFQFTRYEEFKNTLQALLEVKDTYGRGVTDGK